MPAINSSTESPKGVEEHPSIAQTGTNADPNQFFLEVVAALNNPNVQAPNQQNLNLQNVNPPTIALRPRPNNQAPQNEAAAQPPQGGVAYSPATNNPNLPHLPSP